MTNWGNRSAPVAITHALPPIPLPIQSRRRAYLPVTTAFNHLRGLLVNNNNTPTL